MATECVPNTKSARSTDARDNLLLLPVKLLICACMGMFLLSTVAPLVTGKPTLPHIDPHAYMLIGALGVVVMSLWAEQQRRFRELERLLKDHNVHAEPVAGSDGG